MNGKFFAIGVSGILVVGVAIGVIVGVGNKSNGNNDDKVLASASKAVVSICTPTDYKQACVDSLNSVSKNESASPIDFLRAAIMTTFNEIKKNAENPAAVIGKAAEDPKNAERIADCKDLLQYAVDELQASISMVGDSSHHTIKDREAELQNWLSAVVSYQETCIDGFEDQPEIKDAMSRGLLNSTQLTSNALAIVNAMANILKDFKLPVDINTGASRRLLDTEENGYPSWISVGDRKLLASNGNPPPNAVVAKDGSGQFKTIADALKAYPKNNKDGAARYVIYVKAGIYDEYITVTKDQKNVFMYGDGPRKTIVTGKKSYASGVNTMNTASFAVVGDRFIAKSMGFQNTAGPDGHQAVALRVQSDMSAFFNCRMDGYQDTLYIQTHRQFYRNCVISGTVDFIFGDASAIIQNCLIIVRLPNRNQKNAVTAHGRAVQHETTGVVIQNSRVVPEQKLFPLRFEIPTYLGRPWKPYSRAVFMEDTLADFIQPEGWMPWDNTNFALDTCVFREYANRGPGSNTAKRVNWKGYKVITDRKEATAFTAGPFIQGDLWLKETGAPFFLGFRV